MVEINVLHGGVSPRAVSGTCPMHGCLVHSNSSVLPTYNQSILLDSVLCLLRPFEELTRNLSKASACASTVISMVQLQDKLLAHLPGHGLGTMREEMCKSLVHCYADTKDNIVLSAATFLDPRFKERFFMAAHTAQDIPTCLKADRCQIKAEAANTDSPDAPPSKPTCQDAGPASLGDGLLDFMESVQSVTQDAQSIAA